MGRVARQRPVEVEVSDDELPELSTLLKGSTRRSAKNTERPLRLKSVMPSPRRSSPRRQGTVTTCATHTGGGLAFGTSGLDLSKGISAIGLSVPTIALLPPVSPVKRPTLRGSLARTIAKGQLSPVKRNTVLAKNSERESGTATSMQQRQRSLKLAHVNSLLLPLSQIALSGEAIDEGSDVEFVSSREDGEATGDTRVKPEGRTMTQPAAIEKSRSTSHADTRNLENDRARNALRTSPKRAAKDRANHLSRFVLKEARCNDDSDDSSIDHDEDDEFTDLSGFIVDDDAELSVHGSDLDRNDDLESGPDLSKRKESPQKRRLQRKRNEARARMESEDEDIIAGEENLHIGDIAQDLFNLKLYAPTKEEKRAKKAEVIDLTDSPPKTQPELKPKSTTTKHKHERPSPTKPSPPNTYQFLPSQNALLLKLSPPQVKAPAKIPIESSNSPTTTTESLSSKPAATKEASKTYTTPPTTPPASPTKLKSPSKLHVLSPSKCGAVIPSSPHRQSIDAFWSSDVINTWNDQHSPRKPTLTVSPKKHGLARLLDFDIWSDSNDEDADAARNEKNDGSSSFDPPTPTRSSSPCKTSKSPSKLSSLSKKALAESKKLFLSTRHTTAQSLLTHLDIHITSGELSTLSASTGGVRILWSKNLRSTAGRANWRRTVTKASNSSAKNGLEAQPLVQHYASIELAEKVIDSDSRLVNTLAHEFCHLANFMVSGVRDQPHGASFKAWADKVTTHLRTVPGLPELYRTVEVTTKHSYAINHKYLWVCAGIPPLGSVQAAARTFLALDDDPGCGTEYGRHSKSIDPEKHRCGKCKGLLVQVRPRPKMKIGRAEQDVKGESPRKGNWARPTRQRIGIDTDFDENKDEGQGGRDDKLDGLEQALECANLSD